MTDRSWVIEQLGEAAFERLATGLTGSELQSVLLELMQRRASLRKPSQLLAQYQRDAFCAPANVDLRTSTAVDMELLSAAEAFEAIELSPVAPLGCCSSVALTDQNRVLSGLRMTEAVSDPTNVLALECSARLRAQPERPVHLTTCQRVIRAQPVPKLPGYSQHFRLFVLASAGKETKDHAFTIDTVVLHLRTLLSALTRLEQRGYSFGRRRIEVFARNDRTTLAERVAAEFGGLSSCKPLEHAYYSGGLRYQVWVTAPDGDSVPLMDGGVFDWVAKIAANRRAVFVASGGGAQLIPLRFRSTGSP